MVINGELKLYGINGGIQLYFGLKNNNYFYGFLSSLN